MPLLRSDSAPTINPARIPAPRASGSAAMTGITIPTPDVLAVSNAIAYPAAEAIPACANDTIPVVEVRKVRLSAVVPMISVLVATVETQKSAANQGSAAARTTAAGQRSCLRSEDVIMSAVQTGPLA